MGKYSMVAPLLMTFVHCLTVYISIPWIPPRQITKHHWSTPFTFFYSLQDTLYIPINKKTIFETTHDKLMNLDAPILKFVSNTVYQSASHSAMPNSSCLQVSRAMIYYLDSVDLSELRYTVVSSVIIIVCWSLYHTVEDYFINKMKD